MIYVWTHDSIALGEDGPTHQPVEQLASLRAMPNMLVLRPADANETVEAWRIAMQHTAGPVGLVLTRQKIPVLDRTTLAPAAGTAYGAYVLVDADEGLPELILIATGSEVSLALDAHRQLTGEGIRSRVVSMPSCELFEAQSAAYRQAVLPPSVHARVRDPETDPGAHALLERFHIDPLQLPIVLCPSGQLLRNPSETDASRRLSPLSAHVGAAVRRADSSRGERGPR